VLAFKYRKNVACVIGEDSVKSLLESAVGKCPGVKLHVVGVDGDHIHIVVSCPPYWSPISLIRTRVFNSFSAFITPAKDKCAFC